MTANLLRGSHHSSVSASQVRRTFLVRLFGLLLLLLGFVAAAMGPIEFYPLYMFAEGGRFHYEGFQMGSFMFGNISVQIAGYYVAAAILIPLGYGHLRLRNWARKLMLAYTWCWVVLGLPLGLVLLFTLLSVKELPQTLAAGIAVCVALSYVILPWIVVRLYRGRIMKHIFRCRPSHSTWLESIPTPILVLVILFILFAVFLHVPLLFSGLYPLFGTWLSQLPGMTAIDISLMILLVLTWATASRQGWAWYADLLYFSVLTATAISTLARTSLSDLLDLARFPEYEVQILYNMPLRPSHITVIVAIPLVATITAILVSRASFSSPMNTERQLNTLQEEHIQP